MAGVSTGSKPYRSKTTRIASTIWRVAAISAGPRSARPRGRRALSFWGLLGLSAICGLHIRRRYYGNFGNCRRRACPCHPPLYVAKAQHNTPGTTVQRVAVMATAQAQAKIAIPNDLEPYWMPFTANRAFKKRPKMIVGAKDMHYIASDGRRLLDGAAGLWCTNAGHNREPIVEAIQREAATLDYAPAFQFSHPKAFELASRIAALAPADLDHVFFCNSGSEAVDTALKIALAYHNVRGNASRVRLIGRERGYHGVGFGGIAVGGIVNNRKFFGALMAGTDHLPSTYNRAEQAFSVGEPEWGAHLADELDRIVALHDASTIAAVIVEPVAASTGVL